MAIREQEYNVGILKWDSVSVSPGVQNNVYAVAFVATSGDRQSYVEIWGERVCLENPPPKFASSPGESDTVGTKHQSCRRLFDVGAQRKAYSKWASEGARWFDCHKFVWQAALALAPDTVALDRFQSVEHGDHMPPPNPMDFARWICAVCDVSHSHTDVPASFAKIFDQADSKIKT